LGSAYTPVTASAVMLLASKAVISKTAKPMMST